MAVWVPDTPGAPSPPRKRLLQPDERPNSKAVKAGAFHTSRPAHGRGSVVAATPFGATAVGVKADKGVVLAADKRMSYGGFILSRNVKKVYPVTGRVGLAIAGFYADMHGLVKILEAEVRYYETVNGIVMPLRSVAKLLSAILYSSKFLPYYVEAIVGGIDGDGKPRLYVLDPVGAITEEDYIAVGTGSTTALGVLEGEYRDGLTLGEAEELAVKAMKMAMARDSASGDGVDILVVTSDGYRERTIRMATELKVVES